MTYEEWLDTQASKDFHDHLARLSVTVGQVLATLTRAAWQAGYDAADEAWRTGVADAVVPRRRWKAPQKENV